MKRTRPLFDYGQRVLPFKGQDPAKVYAPVVIRRSASWPCAKGPYYDLTAWKAGYVRKTNLPGAIVMPGNKEGMMLDLATGEVYKDTRFATV